VDYQDEQQSALSIALHRKNNEVVNLLINHPNTKIKINIFTKAKMFFTPWSMKTKALKKYEENKLSQKVNKGFQGES
jgi:hypothetical protein